MESGNRSNCITSLDFALLGLFSTAGGEGEVGDCLRGGDGTVTVILSSDCDPCTKGPGKESVGTCALDGGLVVDCPIGCDARGAGVAGFSG